MVSKPESSAPCKKPRRTRALLGRCPKSEGTPNHWPWGNPPLLCAQQNPSYCFLQYVLQEPRNCSHSSFVPHTLCSSILAHELCESGTPYSDCPAQPKCAGNGGHSLPADTYTSTASRSASGKRVLQCANFFPSSVSREMP